MLHGADRTGQDRTEDRTEDRRENRKEDRTEDRTGQRTGQEQYLLGLPLHGGHEEAVHRPSSGPGQSTPGE